MCEIDLYVLLLGHRARVGKNTFATHFVNKMCNNNFYCREYALANELKKSVSTLYNLSDEQVFGNLKDFPSKYKNYIDKEFLFVPDTKAECIGKIVSIPNPEYSEYLTPRKILQLFGSQQRSIYPDIWVDKVFDLINKDSHHVFEYLYDRSDKNIKMYYVITDFRFINEYDFSIKWKNKKYIESFCCVNNIRKHIIPIKITRNVDIGLGSMDESEHNLDSFNSWYSVIENNDSLETFFTQIDDLIKKLVNE